MNIVLAKIQQEPRDPLVCIRPPLYGNSCHLGWTKEVELQPLVVIVIARTPGLRVMQPRAPSIKAWIRGRSCDLFVLQAAVLKSKNAIAETSCEEKIRC